MPRIFKKKPTVLILSYAIDFPSGATIVLVLAGLYLLTSGLRPWLLSRS